MVSDSFKRIINGVRTIFTKDAGSVLNTVENLTVETGKTVEVYVEPVRKSILKRFPVMFMLLVTSGVAATFLGIERIILEYKILDEQPELILLLGLSILVFTGRLYKKLG